MDEKTFINLCRDFINYQRKKEDSLNFVNNDDFSILYRFINSFGWNVIKGENK